MEKVSYILRYDNLKYLQKTIQHQSTKIDLTEKN